MIEAADPTRKESLQQKLSNPAAPLNDFLGHDQCVELFRGNDPAVHAYLKTAHFRQLVRYVSVVGPQQQLLRSYQYPQLACDILMSEHPRIAEVLLQELESDPPSCLLSQIMEYFNGQPNYVLSSYIMKILTNLFYHHPVRIQQFLFEHGWAAKMLSFIASRSISEFLIKLIVVQDDLLLLLYFDQRRQLLLEIIAMYQLNQAREEQLSQISYLLGEVIAKLWSSKYKESGKFSTELFRIVEICLEKTGLFEQETLISIITKNISLHSDEAPFLIKSLCRRIYKELSHTKSDSIETSFKERINTFTLRKMRLLYALTSIFMGNLPIIQPLLVSADYYGLLMALMQKHEWNNLIHVEVEKIFKASLASNSQNIYSAMFKKGDFSNNIISMVKKERQSSKFSKGYSGCFTNILIAVRQALKKETPVGNWIRRDFPDLESFIDDYVLPKLKLHSVDLAGFKVNVVFAAPKYEDSNLLLDRFKTFLDIQQMEQTPTKSQIKEMLDEIENESSVNEQLVKDESDSTHSPTGETVSFGTEPITE